MTQTRRAHDPQTSTEPRSLEATDRRTSGTNEQYVTERSNQTSTYCSQIAHAHSR